MPCVLLDEAQNATSMQMKMFLTRLGEGSRMIVNGDPTQTDLAAGAEIGPQRGGRAARAGSKASAMCVFRHGDVVRHDLVRRIVAAYEKAPSHQDGRDEPAR